MMIQLITCPFCSCLCDDVQVEAGKNGYIRLVTECNRAYTELARYSLKPDLPEVDGQPVSWKEALEVARLLVKKACNPLLINSNDISWEETKRCAILGRKIFACIDTSASKSKGVLVQINSELGLPTCTLGEINNHADALLLCDTRLEQTHPRFWKRFVEKKSNITIINIDDVVPYSDFNLHQQSNRILEKLIALRLGLRSDKMKIPTNIESIIKSMQSAKFGVILFGSDILTQDRITINELIKLGHDLANQNSGKWFFLNLSDGGNATGVVEALSGETGYPCGLRYSSQGLHFSPSAYGTDTLLDRNETDLVFYIGNVDWIKEKSLESEKILPKIVLSWQRSGSVPRVWLPVKRAGLDGSGSFLRMDGVVRRVNPIVHSSRWNINDVLSEIEGDAF